MLVPYLNFIDDASQVVFEVIVERLHVVGVDLNGCASLEDSLVVHTQRQVLLIGSSLLKKGKRRNKMRKNPNELTTTRKVVWKQNLLISVEDVWVGVANFENPRRKRDVAFVSNVGSTLMERHHNL